MCERAVFFVDFLVGGVVDGVEWFHSFLPFCGIFVSDDCAGVVVDAVPECFEVFVFDYPSEWYVGCGVVDYGVALSVGGVLDCGFESQAAVVEPAEPEAVEFVDAPGEDYFACHCGPVFAVGEKVGACQDLASFQEAVDQGVISSDGYSLPGVVEVVVVVGEPYGEAPDYEGGQVGALPAPLFFGVAFDEQAVDVVSYERKGHFLEVAGPGYTPVLHCPDRQGALGVDSASGLFGCDNVGPYAVERVHVEGEVVELPVGCDRQWRVCESVERHQSVDEVPHALVGSVEDVCAVGVHGDTVDVAAVDVAAGVRSFFEYQALETGVGCQSCESGAEEA